MSRHLFTDADNTLWDTNAVYARAQLAMLRDVEGVTTNTAPADSESALAFLRKIDQAIATEHPKHLRYPPVILAMGLALALRGADPVEAAKEALQLGDDKSPFMDIELRFIERLQEIPSLRDGVRVGLLAAASMGFRPTVLTEGPREKCSRTLVWHGLESAVDDVISLAKTPAAYFDIAKKRDSKRPIMVGDQLDRDILFAAEAGFETIYFPSEFLPGWLDNVVIVPDHQISHFDEILSFLHA